MNRKLKILYNLLREFYYEKNGLDDTIEFLEYVLAELKNLSKGGE